MENNFKNEDSYSKARKRVEEVKAFYGHLFSFILINIGLFVVNSVTSPNHLWFDYWFYWQLLFWGIGLLFHGLKTFNYSPFFNKDWKERKIKEILEKENNKQKWE
ncbi:2TM domain-containing protein [Flavobacterium aquicola]|uniref:2TM domain-containing protein n=1 Tax=Flavobacterium aquicola TaxID=1682742 RepID=A0A3E0EUM6_9FLAO|nr:2TM domain-containing protein [Flavobacterium aquicola]REH01130.1 2TM domain-containing protein [Flavobacterium aquicola]